MRKFLPLIVFLIGSYVAFAQTPEKMSYQAIVRDASNTLLVDKLVGIQVSILQNSETGSEVYVETHSVVTNMNGLVALEIGTGVTSYDFSSIDWTNGPYFVKVETDPNGADNYSISGVSQLMSVPFALYAKASGNGITSDQADAIVANTAKTGITSGQADAIVANTAKTGITSDQSDAIVANTAKIGITSDQADSIVANT
ncbi:collagen-like protein, partial [Flavobacteriaceae bacterium]|nr:collagen-like protein [Flavobacteriaceae bacterium]